MPIVSIVGYTTAGKSTLLNALTRSEVFTEDLLFATLDTSTRRLRCPREREAIVINTPTEVYNRDKPDELRCDPHDDRIPYDWSRKDR